jgi:hypothetical protein
MLTLVRAIAVRKAGRIRVRRAGSQRRPICVIGMGRCGTSLTTALLGVLGVDLGPTESMLAAVEDDNARGYWEQRPICDVNEQILELFGGMWAKPPELEPGWENAESLAALGDECGAMLAELYGTAGCRWAWKDPRTAVTLAFWRKLIGEMDYIICVRNPVDVAASLTRRGIHELDFDVCLLLWMRYTQAAIDGTSGARRLILHYEDYFRARDRQLERLSTFVLGRAARRTLKQKRDCIDSFIEPSLWHHRESSAAAIQRVREVTPEAAHLYERLLAMEL